MNVNKKILIFGNSGSGKSTLAKKLAIKYNLTHLDLDTIAWLKSDPPKRRPLEDSKAEIESLLHNHDWVVEGCYTDLLSSLTNESTLMIFLDLPVESCIENAKKRPWEPHKYKTEEDQDKNLDMLIQWISDYSKRSGEFSRQSHLQLYQNYNGVKHLIKKNITDFNF